MSKRRGDLNTSNLNTCRIYSEVSGSIFSQVWRWYLLNHGSPYQNGQRTWTFFLTRPGRVLLCVNKAVKERAAKFTNPYGATIGKMERKKKYKDVLNMIKFICQNLEVFIDEMNVESMITLAYEYEWISSKEICNIICNIVMNNILHYSLKIYLRQS